MLAERYKPWSESADAGERDLWLDPQPLLARSQLVALGDEIGMGSGDR